MDLAAGATLKEVAIAVGHALRKHGIRSVLTGGACANIYTRGRYLSGDADFVLSGRVQRSDLDEAMGSLGFVRDGDHYTHPRVEFFIEFPAGPLAIGSDNAIKPVTITSHGRKASILSATDSCRDQLAAYYHWGDRQALGAAIEIALRNNIGWRTISTWSRKEGHLERYEEFKDSVRLRRSVPRRARAARSSPKLHRRGGS